MLKEPKVKYPLHQTIPGSGLRVIRTSRHADLITPIGVYLNLRDMFPGSVLLESADNTNGTNAKSYIGVLPLAMISADRDECTVEILNSGFTRRYANVEINPFEILEEFHQSFSFEKGGALGVGLIGYMGYNVVSYLEEIEMRRSDAATDIPLFQYCLFRFILEFDHTSHTLQITQCIPDSSHPIDFPEHVFNSGTGTTFPFTLKYDEKSRTTDDAFIGNVISAKQHCSGGDIFQVVLSRRFSQAYSGDDFNVYRALRMINPSPYLFYADFRSFRIFGSSPEAQITSGVNVAELHPIAGTYRKSGDTALDALLSENLLNDKKETAEHTMLVDLARNDLSRFCDNVHVKEYMQVYNYSHVIHLVSKVCGEIREGTTAIDQIRYSFPAGTLSGAPKVRAMEIINESEDFARDWYGGCIGMIGFDGNVNTAIMIRTFLSKNNELHYQAGAGIVIDSDPGLEKEEINNKLGALRQAILTATTL